MYSSMKRLDPLALVEEIHQITSSYAPTRIFDDVIETLTGSLERETNATGKVQIIASDAYLI